MAAGNQRGGLRLDSVDDYNSKEDIVEAEGLKLLKPPKGLGVRHSIAVVTFFGLTMSYIMRVDLSMAIVAMATDDSSVSDTPSDSSDTCPSGASDNSTEISEGEFSWSSGDKGLILGAFFWGYVAIHVPSGKLLEVFGAKKVFGIGMLITAIFQLLTPVVTRWGGEKHSMTAMIILRIIQGLGEGVTCPATHALLSQWSPPFERSKLGAFVYSGMYAGTMCAMLVSGLIINAGFLGGWPGVFYTFGTLAIVWFGFWWYIVADTPAEHPRIDQEELIYIEGSMCGQTTVKKIPTPWKEVLRSKPVWAITSAQFADSWGLYTLLSYMPIYMSSVLHFNMNDNSLLSALPYLCMLVVALISSWSADQLRTKRILSTRNTRRAMNVIGQWVPAIGLVAVSYAGCNKVLTVALLTFTVAFSGSVSAGYLVSHIDIAPNHAGTLMSFCNCISNLAGIAAPYIAGMITTDESSLASWRIVFFLAAAVYFVLNLIYLIFASGREQPWNRPEATEETKGKVNLTEIQFQNKANVV